jgi:hypothetical protein
MPMNKTALESEKEIGNYGPFFEALRKSKRTLFLGCALYLPIVGVGATLLNKIDERLGTALAIIWLGFIFVYGNWMSLLICPRCKKKYLISGRFPYKKILNKKCVSCSLEQPYDDEGFYKRWLLVAFSLLGLIGIYVLILVMLGK